MRFAFGPIPARRLLHRTIDVRGHGFRGVSVLPFFEQGGRVRQILLVIRATGEMFLHPAGQGSIKSPFFGRVSILGNAHPFKPLRKSDLDELGQLWHYDPIWVLDDEIFVGHWAREALKNTNCASRLRKRMLLFYRSDLSSIQGVLYRTATGGFSAGVWDESGLPVRPPHLQSRVWRKHSPAWVLDPIWRRG